VSGWGATGLAQGPDPRQLAPGAPQAANKLTANVKACIMAAFADAGGKDYLVKVAKTDPRTFCTLLGKILPTQVTGDASEPVRIEFSWLEPGGK
jgi:hypothetical protein